MTASQNELKKWFDQLMEEVLGLVDHVGKGRKTSGAIPARSTKMIKTLIEKTAGRLNIITERTIGTYYREGYSDSRSLIGLFAAVALVHLYKGELSAEDCKKYYEENSPSSTEYWNQYIDRGRNRAIPAPTPEYKPDEPQWESETLENARTDLDIFPSPDYEGFFERPSVQEKLFDKICRHRILAIDGIAGGGKKHFVKSMESVFKARGKYNKIWWVPLHKNYTLENLFNELPFEIYDSVKGHGTNTKIRWFEEQLKSNRILVVFYEITQGEQDSFLPLIQGAFDKPGDCMYLVIRDNISLFYEIPPTNSFAVPSYSKEEIRSFLETDYMELSEKNLSIIAEISGGWPFYLSTLKQKCIDQKTLEKVLAAPDLLHDDLSRWFKVWAINLDDNAHLLLQVFFLYNAPISYTDLISIAKNIGLEQPDIQLEVLKNNYFLVKGESGLLSITPVAKLYAGSIPKNGSGTPIHDAISSFIRTKLPIEPSFNFSKEELESWQQVIEHDQQSGHFESSGLILDKIKGSLKRRNKYPLLIKILIQQIEKEPEWKSWFQYDLAHAYFVTGDYEKCLTTLDSCLEIVKEWYPKNVRDADGISFFIKTIQLFAELCSVTGHNKKAISIFTDALSLFDYAELKWNNRCHTITVLSMFYEQDRKTTKSLEMNQNLLSGSYEHNGVSEAVISMRMGLAKKKLGIRDEARRNFSNAKNLFNNIRDQRGKAWAEALLAIDYLQQKSVPFAEKLIKDVIRVHAEGSLSNQHYRRWLRYLSYHASLYNLHPLIESELERTRGVEIDNDHRWDTRLVQRINNLSKWLRFRSKPFDLEAFIKPLMSNDIPTGSVLTQSLERRIQRNPQKFLEKVAARELNQLFSDPHINHQVANCATSFDCQEFIKEKIILKNFDQLLDPVATPDDARIQYAGILYTLGEYQRVLNLLEHVKDGKRGFNYAILRADCLTKLRNFDQAESSYETILNVVGNGVERAIALYKWANLVIEAKNASRYEEALEWSKEAMELNNTDEDFVHHAENTTVYFTVEITPLEGLLLQMQRMKTLYSLSDSRIESIIQSVSNFQKRKLLKAMLAQGIVD